MKTEDALLSFFKGEGVFTELGLRSLPETYIWPRKKWPKFPSWISREFLNHETLFEQNVALKFVLQHIWHSSPAVRPELHKWIVNDWGGILANKDDAYADFAARAGMDEAETPIKRIASFSKILAIKDPNKYAIYDARVAGLPECNTATLVCHRWHSFSVPDGGGITSLVFTSKKRGFSCLKKYSMQALSLPPHGWKSLDKDKAYGVYMETLRGGPRKLSHCKAL